MNDSMKSQYDVNRIPEREERRSYERNLSRIKGVKPRYPGKYGIPAHLPNGEIDPEWERRDNAAKRERYRIDINYRNFVLTRNRNRRLANLARFNRAQRRNKWTRLGLDAEEGDSLYERTQNCQSCGVLFTKTAYKHLDHDHKTQKIRGVICIDCNHMIGKADDNPARLILAAEYLRRTGSISADREEE